MGKFAAIGERMGSHSGAVVRPVVAALLVAMVLLAGAGVAHGSCTVKNTSGNKVVIVPVVDVSVAIEVDVGVSIELPKQYQHCYFKNADSGRQLGPFTLTDGSVVACVHGRAGAGTVDVFATAHSLVSLVLGLLSCLPVVSICASL